MAKSSPSHGISRIVEDALLLAGSFAKLGATLVSHQIQSSAGTASSFIHSKVDLTDMDARLTQATTRVEDAADYALHTDVKHLVDDVASFARKYPVASIISVVAAGALAARLLRPAANVETPVIKAVRKSATKAKATAKRATAKVRAKASGAVPING